MPERALPEYLNEVVETGAVRAGRPLPFGAQRRSDGVNFALFSRNATGIRLELFDRPADGEAARTIELDPVHNRTGDVWHVWVQGIEAGQLYGYRVEGPYRPEDGDRFNPHKLLLDPMAEAVTYHADWDFEPALGYDPDDPDGDDSFSEEDNAALMPKSVFVQEFFDWDGDEPLKRPLSETIIYETHVRGLTIDESSEVDHPGSYRGIVEKIPYLKELGVTAVELMPVQEFNENELQRKNPMTGERLKNYWGYNPVVFTAPESSYCSRGTVGHQVLAFKEMVKALHDAGIEVILDVVLNHTAEGDRFGPTLSLRGVDNGIYYLLEGENRRRYKDYTGTGNTIKADHPVVRDFILNVLRHWVVEMHVDGFRFDLASVLGRDEDGNLLGDPPLLERIAEDPILREAKLIAEAWDAGGAYQVGAFSERRWAEWNGRYRDDVRRFWRGDAGMMPDFARRITGSEDLYAGSGRGPERSIHYVTSHDGFTLNDLVSYERKHNEANGEKNEDGPRESYSANYGEEGPSDDPDIEAVRRRQIKNFLLTLLVSRGVPMLLGGDEFRRTQGGNSNAYCQDNEVSWYDWSMLDEHGEIHRFCQRAIEFRKAHPVLSQDAFYSDEDVVWFGPDGGQPDWDDEEQRSLGWVIKRDGEADLCILFNASPEPVRFAVPSAPEGQPWGLVADTAARAPEDFVEPGTAIELGNEAEIELDARSTVILKTLD